MEKSAFQEITDRLYAEAAKPYHRVSCGSPFILVSDDNENWSFLEMVDTFRGYYDSPANVDLPRYVKVPYSRITRTILTFEGIPEWNRQITSTAG